MALTSFVESRNATDRIKVGNEFYAIKSPKILETNYINQYYRTEPCIMKRLTRGKAYSFIKDIMI